MAKLSFTEEEVLQAVTDSASTKEFLMKLGMKVNNGNYRKAEEICKEYGFKVPKSDSTKQVGNLLGFAKLSDEEFFVDGILRKGPSIRKRLVEDHKIPDECSECGQAPFWNGKPLTLQVDHIDGNRFNNLIKNLRILCGHCHSQTPTYANNRGIAAYNYCKCGIRVSNKVKACKDCTVETLIANNVSRTKITYPPIPELLKEINESSFVAVAARLGVSDNAIRAHIKRNAGSDAVPRGYAKNPKRSAPSRGQQFLATANVDDIIGEIEKPGNSVKSFAASIYTDPKRLREWINEKLGYTYIAPRNKQVVNPNQGKVNYPPIDELLVSIASNGSEHTARSLGVTSKAVERYLRKHLPETAFPLLRSGFLENYKNN